MLLQPLPFRDPSRLVQVWETHPQLHNLQLSVPDYLDWKKSIKGLQLAAYTFQAMDKATLTGQGEPMAVQGTNASADLFPLLGINPLLGRVYGAEEENSKQRVALIGEQLWRHKFSSDPNVIGRPFRLGETSFIVIGVLAERNAFPAWADVWLPFSSIDPELYSSRKYHPLELVGRLNRGVSLRQAELGLEQTALQLSAAYPATNGKIGAFAVPLMETVIGDVRPAFLAAWIAAGLVLLMACSNLAHLMMDRALNRKQEVSIRLALGASRWAVFRTFLVETMVLSLTGGGLGILAAIFTLPLIQNLAEGEIPRINGAALNLSVLLFGTLCSFLVAVLFASPSYTISSATTRGASVRRARLSSILLGSEVALSVTVLLAALVLVRSFSLTLHTEPGFRTANTLAVHVPLADRDWNKSYNLFHDRIAPELEHVSGVQAVAAVNSLPMTLRTTEHSRYATRFGIVGKNFEPGRFPTAQIRWCTPNYLQVLGVPLIRGRFLMEEDHNQPRYVINQAFADRYFPHADPMKAEILLNVTGPRPDRAEIVGVVGDMREFGLVSAAEPTLFFVDISPEMEIVIKTHPVSAVLPKLVERTLRRAHPAQAIGRVRRLDGYLADSLARQRFILVLITTFAGLAVFLGALGIYGVFSYSVSRRLREFGIRSAIGAQQRDLMFQVLRECLTVVVPGLLTGLAISAACSRFMQVLLYHVSATDPIASIVTVSAVLGLALSCVAIPALRAARTEPSSILREE